MTIIGFIGAQGEGKTMSMTTWIRMYWEMGGYIVIANYDLFIPHIKFDEDMFTSKNALETIRKKYNVKKIILALDEAHLLLGAHMAKKDAKKAYLVSQCRKLLKGGHMLWTTQFPNQINLTLRNNTEIIINVSKSMKRVYDEYTGELAVEYMSYTWTFLKDDPKRPSWMKSVNEIDIPEFVLAKGSYEELGDVMLSRDY